MNRKVAALLVLVLMSPASALAATYWQYPDTGGLIGTEVLPLSFPQGGGIYQTRKTTVNSISTFVEADLLSKANTWTLGQIWSSQSTFNASPIFATMTGYCYAHGAGVPITCATTIPMSVITGPLPAAQVPVATSSTLGGVETATAPTNQFMTGINSSGVPTFARPAFSDLTGSIALSATTGQLLAGQIPNSIITLGMMANFQANSLMGNNSGSPSVPVPVSMSSALDMISSTQGDILIRGASTWGVLTSVAQGSILVKGASTWSALAPGSTGQTLTMGATVPQWGSAGTLGDPYTLLATLTPTSGGSTAATSLAAYSYYYITINNIATSSVGNLTVAISINNGSAYTDTAMQLGSGQTSFYGFASIDGSNADVATCRGGAGATSTAQQPSIVNDTYILPGGQINALRISTSAGHFNSGTIKIYGR